MKKQISKLTLKRETLKILLEREVSRVRGGAVPVEPKGDCVTHIDSGCGPQ